LIIELDVKRLLARSALVDHESDIVLQLFTDYHGMQLLSDGFIDFLVDEGVLEPFEKEE